MASELNAETKRRLRGVVLEIVADNHAKQNARLDHITLWGVLERLDYEVSRNDVLTLLQDLRGRCYLDFQVTKDADTGRVSIRKIEITPKGRDLVEKTETDKAVVIL